MKPFPIHYLTRAILPCWLVAPCLILLLFSSVVSASDHADPINLRRKEGGITDLFVFPTKNDTRGVEVGRDDKGKPKFRPITIDEADQLAIVFCVRPSLTTSPPYGGLNEYTYSIYIDSHSEVRFENKLDVKRYGGIVAKPESIAADFSITIRLNDDTSIKELTIQTKTDNTWKVIGKSIDGKWGPRPDTLFKKYSGVRDDPFIFPMFFGTNVIAMVFSVPLAYLPQQDFLIWGTSARNEVQIDHVGRSQRTQLPRFDLLNTLHPSKHVAALRQQAKDPGLIDDFLRTQIRPVFNLRPYDFQPDVMIYSKGSAAVYPNGRQLEDDVAKLTCDSGDCQLFELSFAVADPKPYEATGGRPTRNDKEFSNTFPYLAEPWPDKPPAPAAGTNDAESCPDRHPHRGYSRRISVPVGTLLSSRKAIQDPGAALKDARV